MYFKLRKYSLITQNEVFYLRCLVFAAPYSEWSRLGTVYKVTHVNKAKISGKLQLRGGNNVHLGNDANTNRDPLYRILLPEEPEFFVVWMPQGFVNFPLSFWSMLVWQHDVTAADWSAAH